jgi:hypothetical protein
MMDKGYVGVKNTHPGVAVVIPFKASRGHPLTDEQKDSNRVVASYRIVAEHAMAQLNRFTVLRLSSEAGSGRGMARWFGWWRSCSTGGWR